MNVRIQSLVRGARASTGQVVLIDVFTSATLAASVLANGARRVVPVPNAAAGRAWRRREPDAVLIGEWMGKKLGGFDHNTNALGASRLDVAGRSVVLSTTNGTAGIFAAAPGADAVFFGSFRNASALCEHLAGEESVCLVPIGLAGGRMRAIEDELCAEFLRDRLLGRDTDFAAIERRIRRDLSSRVRNVGRSADVAFCLQVDAADVVPRLDGEALVAVR